MRRGNGRWLVIGWALLVINLCGGVWHVTQIVAGDAPADRAVLLAGNASAVGLMLDLVRQEGWWPR